MLFMLISSLSCVFDLVQVGNSVVCVPEYEFSCYLIHAVI